MLKRNKKKNLYVQTKTLFELSQCCTNALEIKFKKVGQKLKFSPSLKKLHNINDNEKNKYPEVIYNNPEGIKLLSRKSLGLLVVLVKSPFVQYTTFFEILL